MQVDLTSLKVSELAVISDDGYHMFSDWNLKGPGYFFFHWPAGGFHPDAYYFDGTQSVRLTTDKMSTKPKMAPDGGLYINKVIDEEKKVYQYSRLDLETMESKKVKDIEGFDLSGRYFVKQIIEGNHTRFILEDLKGNDIRDLGTVPFTGVMFETVDPHLKYLAFNTSFEQGTIMYILDLKTQDLRKLHTQP
jgi:hypothetical protein